MIQRTQYSKTSNSKLNKYPYSDAFSCIAIWKEQRSFIVYESNNNNTRFWSPSTFVILANSSFRFMIPQMMLLRHLTIDGIFERLNLFNKIKIYSQWWSYILRLTYAYNRINIFSLNVFEMDKNKKKTKETSEEKCS